MAFSPLVNQLIEALVCLPGVGKKSAQRMALHLLERDRQGGQRLAAVLEEATLRIKHCESCRSFCEDQFCLLCADPRRNRALLCIVETPADVLAIEQAAHFSGLYFVLMGHLSPLDGVGPDQIGIKELISRLDQGEILELILATNPTVEGQVTAHYISSLARQRGIKTTRIAHGVPLGGELEFVDGGTLAHAFADRILLED